MPIWPSTLNYSVTWATKKVRSAKDAEEWKKRKGVAKLKVKVKIMLITRGISESGNGDKVMTHETGLCTSAHHAHGSSSVRVEFIMAKETAAVRYMRWCQVQVVLRKRYFWQQERGLGATACLLYDLRSPRVSKNVCDNTTVKTKERKINLKRTDVDVNTQPKRYMAQSCFKHWSFTS